ncbi:MAG: DUF6155 family protein [Salinivirgaceae bacterium]|jgi:hypothetical protein|nr:DUF6155 family protein [Salinivirgaceae bacterium]
MSKRELKKYVSELTKAQLQEQIIDLYERFRDVKQYYDFAFNPNENKLLDECKFKISKEYFPVNRRKPKMRRSVAQKYIKHFKTLGVEPAIIADVMLYNIEIAQAFCADKPIKTDGFYTSMLKSFSEAVTYIFDNGLSKTMQLRMDKIVDETIDQNWFNSKGFEMAIM